MKFRKCMTGITRKTNAIILSVRQILTFAKECETIMKMLTACLGLQRSGLQHNSHKV